MQDLLSIGTNRRESMIGTGIGLGLAGYRLRTSFEAMPSLDLQFADRRMIQAVLGPTPSFSRASTGTFFNSQGVLSSAAVNEPRFNHVYNGTSWVSRGLLVEEQRTNIITNSEDFSDASWVKANSATIATNDSTAPDGNSTADRITAASNTSSVYKSLTVVSGQTYSFSVFAKAGNFSKIVMEHRQSGINADAVFDLSNGTLVSGTGLITSIGNGWYRCSVSEATVDTSDLFIIGFESTATNGSYVYLWGAQLELGAFPTSYIGTTNSSVVRSSDVCQITGTDFSGFWNGTEGSVACEFDVSSGYTSSAMTIANFYQSGSSWIGFRSIESTSNNVFDCYSGGVQQARLGFSRSNPGISARLAAAFKANDFAASQNGSAVLTDTSGSLPSPTYLELGTFTGFGEYLNGHIARLRYYPVRLTNAKLQELST